MTTETAQTTTRKSGRRSAGFHRLLVLGIVGTLLLTACGTADSDNESVTETTTTTVPPTTSTTAAPTTTTTVPTASIALGGNGIGVVELGAEPEAAIAAVSALLGAPTSDSGWIDAAATTCPGTEFREVAWERLFLRFNDAADATAPAGGRHFFSYWYAGDTGLTTVEGIGLGATVADLETTYGKALWTENSPAI